MTEGKQATPGRVVPRPMAPRPAAPRPAAPPSPVQVRPPVQVPAPRPASSRAAARQELEVALAGARLAGGDRQFLARLIHWDKRNAASVASLAWRARQAGREEEALSPAQLEMVVAALRDAATYRMSGADALGCWDCEGIPGGRCAEHASDADRARAYTELATALAGGLPAAAGRLASITRYRRRRSVAS